MTPGDKQAHQKWYLGTLHWAARIVVSKINKSLMDTFRNTHTKSKYQYHYVTTDSLDTIGRYIIIVSKHRNEDFVLLW